MSSFICQHCGADIVDSPYGYITGCEHFPMETRISTHKMAEQIADELLRENPKYYQGRRHWARVRLIQIAAEQLNDLDLPEDNRESTAREAACEWLHESWTNRE